MSTMIITLTNELKEKLTLLAKVAGQKSGNTYPDGVLIEQQNLTAANATVFVKAVLGQEELGLMPQIFDKPVVIPVKGIRAILDSPTGEEISLGLDGNIIEIKKKSKRGKITVAALDNKSFPSFEGESSGSVDRLNIEEFTICVSSVRHSIAEKSPKPVCNGLVIKAVNGEIYFESINGFTASRCRRKYQTDSEFCIIVPRTCLDTVMDAVKKTDNVETLSVVRSKDGRHAVFAVGQGLFIQTRLIDGAPINTESFFEPKANSFTVQKDILLGVLKSIQTIQEDIAAPVVLTVKESDKEIEVSYSGTTSKLTETITIDNVVGDGNEVKIGLNGLYLTETLKAITSERVKISYVNSTTIVLLEDNLDNKHIIVPVRLSK